MFAKIPQKRLLLYIMVVGLLPILFAWFLMSSQMASVDALKNRIWLVQEKAVQKEKKQSLNTAVQQHYQEADHFYIDKNLESLTLLEPEITSLKSMLNKPNFPIDDNIKKRLDQLTGVGNKMVFTEGVVQSMPNFQEVTETLAHPVEVNTHDIQELLCRIEGVSIGDCTPPEDRPQLLILDFKIEKKNVSEKNQVYQLNLKLLKREFL